MAAAKPSPVETLVPIAAVASLVATGLAGLVALAALLTIWFFFGPAGRSRWIAGGLGVLALALLAWGVAAERASLDPARKRQAIEREFGALWTALDSVAATAAGSLTDGDRGAGGASQAFARLVDLVESEPDQRVTLLLVDGSGTPVAWAGAGLLHDVEEERLPAQGRGFRLGFQSATLFSVARVGWSGERVVAGRSLWTGDLPRRDRSLGPIRWTVFRQGDVVPEELVELDTGRGPTIALEDWSTERRAPDPWASRYRRSGTVVLALALLALALSRKAGRGAAWILAAAAAALALAGRLDLVTGGSLVLATLVGASSWWRSVPSRLPLPPPWARGVGGLVAVGAALWALERARPDLDLGSTLSAGDEQFAWRLVAFGLTLGWLAMHGLQATDPDAEGPRMPWAWISVALLVAAGAAHDLHPLLVALLAGGGAATAAVWADRQPRPSRLGTGAVLCLLAALLAAVSWEAIYRQNLKYHLSSTVLPGLARPQAADLQLLRQNLERHFSELDLDSLVLPNPAGLDPQDLGIAVWRDSPLAVRGALSAVTARPFGGAPSSFSYGLPLTREGEVDWSPTRWRKVEEPSPEGSVISGATRFLHGGRPWADVSYTLLMRPGFELSRRPIDSLAAGLLRGGPGPFRPDPELIEPALYGLYRPTGEAIEAAWPGAVLPLDRLLAESGSAVAAPFGRAIGFAVAGEDGIRVLLLPVLGPTAALERVGTHAVAVLLALAALTLFGWLCTLRKLPTLSALVPVWRSYSKRLLLVTSLLLLVPVVLMNTFAFRVLGEHLETEQQVAGESALESAQRVLGEYIQALDPGFGVESILDDQLLSWLSRVVHHEVNLYWGSSVYASSKSELFSAGLLPKRIPGEIYAQLALTGARRASRVNQAGRTDYLELYAPLEIPGESEAARRLFLSVPLLAQQVETAEELASLRRQVLLATVALVLLLLAVGNRLARGFTVPLMQIVNGTQRIASGAQSLDLEPEDVELATLVDAIDQMAQRIAEGRHRLMREKTLVERVIDNVNSGVVSLDDERRVLLINQAARDLLGVEVGDALPEILGRAARLEPVTRFLARVGSRPLLETVRLPDEEAEWSLVWVPIPGAGEPSALLVVEDVTEVLRGQRLQAWAEMARIIAHEIKNPLTPIRLSAEHMREVRAARPDEFDRVFERCTANILDQVGELQQISSEFSAYSRLPKIELREGDLAESVRKVVEGYSGAGPDGVRFVLEGDAATLISRFDDKLLGRALRNLIENALRATANGGGVEVVVGRKDDRTSIRVLDQGPGVKPDILPRIFDPYFSTHDSGTGLGLAIARRIAEEHGGGIHARNRRRGGLEVELWLPPSP